MKLKVVAGGLRGGERESGYEDAEEASAGAWPVIVMRPVVAVWKYTR